MHASAPLGRLPADLRQAHCSRGPDEWRRLNTPVTLFRIIAARGDANLAPAADGADAGAACQAFRRTFQK